MQQIPRVVLASALVVVIAVAGASAARAQAPEAAPAAPAAAGPAAPAPMASEAAASVPATPPPATPAPPPYALPWQLRAAAPASVVRLDSTLAKYENAAGDAGTTVASTLLLSYKLTPTLAPIVRAALVWNDSPGAATGGGVAVGNPILGAVYGRSITSAPAWRYAALAAVAVPIGTGGDKPAGMDATAAAIGSGIRARAGLDNALFAVNYLTPLVGLDVAYVAGGLTVQAEVTVLQLFRVRNSNQMSGADASRTNATAGLFAGYFFVPWLSGGVELRHQRWLSTPKLVTATPAARDTTTFAVGLRGHVRLADKKWLRPGVSYALGLDDPLKGDKAHLIQLDLPFAF